MFCKNCGKEIDDKAVVCVNCGVPVSSYPATKPAPVNEEDRSNAGINFLSFLIPVVGIILYFVQRDEKPKEARGALRWALISLVAEVVISFFIVIGMFGIAFLATGEKIDMIKTAIPVYREFADLGLSV